MGLDFDSYLIDNVSKHVCKLNRLSTGFCVYEQFVKPMNVFKHFRHHSSFSRIR